MKIDLSNCEIKAYRKRTGYLSFHLKTVMLFDCGINFSTSYINSWSALFTLTNGEAVAFDEISVNSYSDFEFDGHHNAITLDLKTVSKLTQVDEGVIKVNIYCHLDLVGLGGDINHEQKGVLKAMYLGL
jgi:hypothetical protein